MGQKMKKKKNRKNKLRAGAGKKSSPYRTYLIAAVLLVALTAVALYIFAGPGKPETRDEGAKYMDVTKPVATIEMEDGAIIKVELDPVNAPNTVKNFIYLANSSYYDGLIFHRVIPGFMIQGGCPRGEGTGGPGYDIKGEFTGNDHENNIRHQRGVISMARSRHADSAGSQFFIMVDDATHLDGQYAAFGQVLEGLETVDRIVNVRRDQNDRPLEEQKIRQITVETFGTDYGPPDKM